MPVQRLNSEVREARNVSNFVFDVKEKEGLLAIAIKSAIGRAVDEIVQQTKTRHKKYKPILRIPGIGPQPYSVPGKYVRVRLLPETGPLSCNVLADQAHYPDIQNLTANAARTVLGEKFLIGGCDRAIQEFEAAGGFHNDLFACDVSVTSNELSLARVEHLGGLQKASDRSKAARVLKATQGRGSFSDTDDDLKSAVANPCNVVAWSPQRERPYAGRLSIAPRLPFLYCHEFPVVNGLQAPPYTGYGTLESHLLKVPVTTQQSIATIVREVDALLRQQ